MCQASLGDLALWCGVALVSIFLTRRLHRGI